MLKTMREDTLVFDESQEETGIPGEKQRPAARH
jgi:hypothetical protein